MKTTRTAARNSQVAAAAACALLCGCIEDDNPSRIDYADESDMAADMATTDAAPDVLDPDAGSSEAPRCLTSAAGAFSAPSASLPPPDGCDTQCIRLAHCASWTWADGSDLCACLDELDESDLLAACRSACRTPRGDVLNRAIRNADVCSQIVPAVALRFPSFDSACGDRP